MLQHIHIAAYEQNLFEIACRNIFRKHVELLPDLSGITIFLPNQLSIKLFQNVLMKHAAKHDCQALLLPQLTTLRSWVLSQHTLSKPLLSQYARELILVDAIKKQPSIFLQANPWLIAHELLSFFDAMQLNNTNLESIQSNIHKVITENHLSSNASNTLSQEAELVNTLWQAWKEQLNDEYYLDPAQIYSHLLDNLKLSNQSIYYAVGIEKLCQQEIILLNRMQRESYLYALFHASNPEFSTRPDDAIKLITNENTKITSNTKKNISDYSKFLDTVFQFDEKSMQKRAANFANTYPNNPIKNKISLFKANSFEQHVHAIDIKIRCHILSNKNNVGVITSDRKLVRRLRAILEHANIQINDIGGWALATTSTVVVIEGWLQLIEEGYSSNSLLALLKSPFFPLKVDLSLHSKSVNYLEKDIILASKTFRGLHALRNIIEQQSSDNKLENDIYIYLLKLLDQIEASTQGLTKLFKSKNINLQLFFITLINSLKTQGVYTTLSNDLAGKQLLNLFEVQISQLRHIENNLNWQECRRFLARILDQQNFKPTPINSNVTFCSLEQSRLLKFDALIIASASKNYFPGTSSNYIFFNESIRRELNISTWKDDNTIYLHQFRYLLNASNEILITTETERDGNQLRPSPWLEAIETFHKLAYSESLLDIELMQLIEVEANTIENPQKIELPKRAKQPSPLLDTANKPNTISISQYQQLINCPYQFFAKTCLKLSKTEELQEDLAKSDFGSLVHDCIHAFFENRPLLPGPFKSIVTTENFKEAEILLSEISDAVFKQHTQTNLNNVLWLQRWKNLIPNYLEWEIKRQNTFKTENHEYSEKIEISDNLLLKGQIDRIDSNNNAFAIVDYKTGSIPRKNDVTSGEKVQLPSYALLLQNCTQVEHLNIGKNNTVRSETIIKDEELVELVRQHKERLENFSKQLNNDVLLPALSEDDNCDWCDVSGLCRKDYWQI